MSGVTEKPIMPVETKANEKVEIRSNPVGAIGSSACYKRLEVTPLSIDKQTYLNQDILVTYGTKFYRIKMRQDDTIVNISFK
jgi:hypothetical protein